MVNMGGNDWDLLRICRNGGEWVGKVRNGWEGWGMDGNDFKL